MLLRKKCFQPISFFLVTFLAIAFHVSVLRSQLSNVLRQGILDKILNIYSNIYLILDIRKHIFHCLGGQALQWVAQQGGGATIPGI